MMCLAFDDATIEQVQSAECDLGHFGKTQAEKACFAAVSADFDRRRRLMLGKRTGM
jgi:hypothetical protein